VALRQSPSVKSSPIAEPSSESIGPTCQSTRTLENSPPAASMQTEFPWTLSVADSHARTYRPLAKVEELRGKGLASGARSLELLARFNRGLSLWKTSQISWLEPTGDGLAEFSGTWPRSGLMLNGTAYQRQTLERHTSGIAFGLWLTPRKQAARTANHKRVSSGRDNGNLEDLVAIQEGLQTGLVKWSLCPEWCEWLMGFPIGWTALEPSEIPSSPRFRKSLAAPSCKPKRKG